MPLDAIQVFSVLDRITDANGVPVSGATVEFYEAGTGTPKTVYADADLTVALGTSITTDAGGYPMTDSDVKTLVYTGTDAYKIVVKDAGGSTLFTHDNVRGANETPTTNDTAIAVTAVTSKASDYSVLTTDRGKLINVNCTGGAVVISLLSAVTAGDGFRVGVRHVGTANTVSAVALLGQTISHSGLASTAAPLTGYGESFWLVSDGANWHVDTYAPPIITGGLCYIKITSRLATPPTSPVGGARYIVTGTPTGAWATGGFAEHDVAEYDGNGGWNRYTPTAGWLAFVDGENLLTQFRSSTWTDLNNITAPTSAALSVATFSDVKAQNTGGGVPTSGAWTIRTINTTVTNGITGAALASNQITLPTGTYHVIATAPYYSTDSTHQRFISTTTPAKVLYAPQGYFRYLNSTGDDDTERASGTLTTVGILSVTDATEAFELQYYVSNASGGVSGLGVQRNVSGESEQYTRVTFIKLESMQGPQGVQGDQGIQGLKGDPGVPGADLMATSGLDVAAEKFIEASGASVSPSVYHSISWTSGTAYKIYVLARSASRSSINIFCNTGAVFDCTFDLATGSATGSGATILDVGHEWYLCSVSVTAGATASGNLQFRIYPSSGGVPYAGDGTSFVYVASPLLYVSGTTTQLLGANTFADAYWTKTDVSVTAATVTSTPTAVLVEALDIVLMGATTGDKFIEASGSGSPSVYRTISWSNGSVYSIYVDAKAAERPRLNLYCGTGAVFDCTFDLTIGACAGTGATITSLGNDWFRCAVSVTASATAAGNLQLRVYPATGGHPYTGDGTSGVYVNDASVTTGGGANILTSSAAFSGSGWSKQNVSVTPDVALYIGVASNMARPYRPWSGLKHAALGTSITAQDQYASALASKLGTVLTNLGSSGGSLGVSSVAHYGSLAIYNSIASIPTDAKLVTVEAGTNDFGDGIVPLGTLGDTTTATFYGALYAAVVAIRARAADATIVFLTPYSASSAVTAYTHLYSRPSDSAKLRQFQQAVQDVAHWTGWPCIDVGREAGINYWTAVDLTSDGLHINAAGGAVYTQYVADKINALKPAYV